jgi:hypothetical protein
MTPHVASSKTEAALTCPRQRRIIPVSVSDYELIAQQVSGLNERVDRLDARLSRVGPR